MSETVSQQEIKIPTPLDVEWTDYVLSHLDPTELVDKSPKVAGLRRLCEKFIGEIVATHVRAIQVPCIDNQFRATVEVTIHIERNLDGKLRIYSDVSDTSADNSSPPFRNYQAAMSQTRALGRALRQALKINVVTAEELDKNDNSPATPTPVDNEQIAEVQIRGIDKFCKELDISVKDLVNLGDTKYANIKECNKTAGTALLKQVQEMTKNVNLIDTNKIGKYDPDWKSSFA